MHSRPRFIDDLTDFRHGTFQVVVNDDLERAVTEVSQIIDEAGTGVHRPSVEELNSLVQDMMSEATRVS